MKAACRPRGLRHLVVLLGVWPVLGCQPTVQMGLVSVPPPTVTANYAATFRPYDVIANGYETCPAAGADDPLPGRYPPCPKPAANRARMAAAPAAR